MKSTRPREAAHLKLSHQPQGQVNKPRTLIAGLGRTGSKLVDRLCSDWEVVGVDIDPGVLESPGLAGCAVLHVGDATSAHVLRSTGIETTQVVVACTDSDEKNLEILKVARERFGIERRYALLRQHEWQPRYAEDPGIEVIDRFQACAAVAASRVTGGRRIATEIGLGLGEIMEVEVLANASVVGKRLATLRPRRWLVGAVYRGEQLIVPHGDTIIEAGDRVVIIGDPDVLPSIATHIGAGESEFPLHYGSRIVVAQVEGLAALLSEVRYLLDATAARQFTLHLCEGNAERARAICAEADLSAEIIQHDPRTTRAARVASVGDDVGIFVLPPEPLGALQRVGVRRSPTVRTIDRVGAPVLVSRGSAPYNKVLLVLAELPFSMEAARVAVDLVRMLKTKLHLGVVHHSELVVGAQLRAEMDERRRQVIELAQMYKISVPVVEMQGNPIHEVVKLSREYDLVVVPYEKNRRSSLTRPDVAQNLLHRVSCSALAMPYEP